MFIQLANFSQSLKTLSLINSSLDFYLTKHKNHNSNK